MLQADFVEGIAVINKMLNTAARVRVAGLAALAYGQVRQQNPGYGISFRAGSLGS